MSERVAPSMIKKRVRRLVEKLERLRAVNPHFAALIDGVIDAALDAFPDRPTCYRLDRRTPVPIPFADWCKWFKTGAAAIAQDQIGESRISTVFLGIDQSFGAGTPELFETMIFGGPLSGEHDRYPTYDEAEAGHHGFCQRVTRMQERRAQARRLREPH